MSEQTQTVERETPVDDDLDHWWTSINPDVPVCEYDGPRLVRLMSRLVMDTTPPPPGACVVCLDYYRKALSR